MNERTGKTFGGSVLVLAAAIVLGSAAAAMPAQAEARPGASPVDASRAGTTTYHFSDIPVRSALQFLAEEGNFNLVVADSVQGTVSLHLTDVTWEQALDIVLKLKGLEQHVAGDSRSVAPKGSPGTGRP